ncbi:16S rRNA (cytosine(967)-C(5))-methyltransferase RsmB [Tissierella sp. Yu-01]|uniref:16S rRNA (cytosine(967)-C(5))-methyltransferase RsmB n=1 Tax=Tissierella sp. Yu-01 TaxID=3035694 RepID=UPI00240D2DB1|nr:16S rRNA (cytosine(967)-C(5))-methyltransferase RsmB [Tissierella sp. Yu-01]WFA09813.1 16S rRNA (cytosine(967)-C(5))-methyltransferase RsmB [Tissierella sp. Yu-01]
MNSREIALNTLLDIDKNKSYSNLSISKHISGELSQQDENFIRELVYGVLENKSYIDHILSKVSKVKLKKIHPAILEIIRLGIYQLVFMDRVPTSAAVNESVNLAKKYGHKGSIGFVNGVLRNISRDKENISKIEIKDKVKYLSIKYSHPEFLVKRFIEEFGYEFTEELLIANNTTPKLNLRVNTLKTTKSELMKRLMDKGFIVTEGKYAKDAIIIHNPSRITSLDEFMNGYFTIQDESSMLVGQVLAPIEGSMVIDVCSAPGGKSTHMAQLMNNKGKILSRDLFDHKIKLVDENRKRLGIDIIDTQVYNALNLDTGLIGKFDYCLVDAPCSGFGLIRRKPEIKWNRTEEDINELSTLQIKILEISKNYLKYNGVLLYSTCTIIDDENINIIKKFLEDNPEFKLVSINDELYNAEKIDSAKDGYIQLYPNIHSTDGFFIAKMVKQG